MFDLMSMMEAAETACQCSLSNSKQEAKYFFLIAGGADW
jgi:hypothetical protein